MTTGIDGAGPNKDVFEVEEVRGCQVVGGAMYYLIKWKGFDEINWEPESNCQGCGDLINQFWITHSSQLP